MSRITMKNIAAMSVQYVHYSFDYYLESMQKCSLTNVDLWGGIPHYCRLDYPWTPNAVRRTSELRKKIEDRGMKVVVYTPETLGYPYSFSSPQREVRERTVDYFSMAMDDALQFGTDKVFLNSGCGLLDLPREESWARCRDTFRTICTIAEQKNITMVLEQLQPYESDLVVTLPDVARMLEEVDSPALKVCIDVVAMSVSRERIEEYFKVLGPDAIALNHYADTFHYILGDGDLPLVDYIRELEELDYEGIVDLEINDSIYWADPHTSLLRSVEYLRRFLPEA